MARARTALLALLLSLLPAGSAAAHSLIVFTVTPDSFGRAADVPDPDVSRVIYRELSPGSPQTWIRFRGSKGKRISFDMGVPRIDRMAGFRPSVALVGPGLPGVSLPFDLPPGAGAQVFPSRYGAQTVPPVFHEEFTGTYSWVHVKSEVLLPESGEYYLVIFAPGPGETAGKAWLAVGTKERFTLAEIFGLGKVKRFVREFHEVR